MSERELNRVEVLAQVDDGRLTVDNAANMLELTRRQIFRLLRRYRQDGAAAIRHKAREKPPNNRIHKAKRDYALSLIKESYADFGPTLAAEMLAEHHGFKVSRETVRKWMQETFTMLHFFCNAAKVSFSFCWREVHDLRRSLADMVEHGLARIFRWSGRRFYCGFYHRVCRGNVRARCRCCYLGWTCRTNRGNPRKSLGYEGGYQQAPFTTSSINLRTQGRSRSAALAHLADCVRRP